MSFFPFHLNRAEDAKDPGAVIRDIVNRELWSGRDKVKARHKISETTVSTRKAEEEACSVSLENFGPPIFA